MFRIAVKQLSNCRFFYTNFVRLTDNVQKLEILTNLKKDSPEFSDLSDDNSFLSKPPVYTEPFAELQTDESKKMPSEIAEFVDSLGPPLPVAFNLAAFVNHSESLQNLVQLGVDLSVVEKKPDRAKFVLNLDFEKHVKNHIQFLHDNGVSADDLGKLFTKNIFLLKERVEDLEIRLNYLKSKKFTDDAIARIITSNPFFLSLDTKQADSRLGFFQKQFSLTGDEVRYLVTKCPKLITYSMDNFREILFSMKEELGLTRRDMKKLLLAKPKVWMIGRFDLKKRFEVVHNLMGLSHETIMKFPEIFTRRDFIIKQRHLYLVHLQRAQYDPTQPLYVSPRDLVLLSDSEFCEKCAHTSVSLYNEFLKTL